MPRIDKSICVDLLRTLSKETGCLMRKIDDALEAIETESGDKNIEKEINKAISAFEKTYLESKKLAAISRAASVGGEGRGNINPNSIIDFPASLKKCVNRDEYVFILPALQSKVISKKSAVDGKAIEGLVKYLIDQYEMKNGRLKMFKEKAVGIFIHHVSDNSLSKALDADNIDIKKVTDVLHGYLIPEDSLQNFVPLHLSVVEEQDYCELHIFPYSMLLEWLIKNKKTLELK